MSPRLPTLAPWRPRPRFSAGSTSSPSSPVGTGPPYAAAASSDADDLLKRVEEHLASDGIPAEPLEGVHAAAGAPDPDGVRELLVSGAREHVGCRIRYLEPVDPEPEDRLVHPYVVAHAEGHWYVVGWCATSGGQRPFRLDRIMDVRLTDAVFDPSAHPVDVEAFLQGGRVCHADEATEVVMRYSPVVARWVAEWAPAPGARDDGSLLVRHRVADPDWMVRHVRAYGGEAELVEPMSVRRTLAGLG